MKLHRGQISLFWLATRAFSCAVLLRSAVAGVPEPGLTLYGKVLQGNEVVTQGGTVTWVYTPRGGGMAVQRGVALTARAAQGGEVYSYVLDLPAEAAAPGAPLEGTKLPATNSSVIYDRTVFFNGQPAVIVAPAAAVDSFSRADEGRIDRADVRIPVQNRAIEVTSISNPGDWARGSTQSIDWRIDVGVAGVAYRIELVPVGGGKPILLAIYWDPSTAAQRTFSLVIPADLAAGDYLIRVTSTWLEGNSGFASAGTPFSESTQVVHVNSLIEVVSPGGSPAWSPGSSQEVAWRTDPSMIGVPVMIQLRSLADAGTFNLISSPFRTSSSSEGVRVTIPPQIPTGLYRVRVGTTLSRGGPGTASETFGESPAVVFVHPQAAGVTGPDWSQYD